MIRAGAIRRRFLSLSARERALVALMLLAAIAFGAVRFGVYPALDRHRKLVAEIPRKRALLAQYRAAALGRDNVAAALEEARLRVAEMEKGLLPGDTPSAAGATLQGMVKPVDRPDTRLTSVRALPPEDREPYAEVAVQVDFQTTTEGLAQVLSVVPRSPRLLRVRRLSVSSGYYGAAAANRREVLVVSAVVAGLAKGGEPKEEKEAGGAR